MKIDPKLIGITIRGSYPLTDDFIVMMFYPMCEDGLWKPIKNHPSKLSEFLIAGPMELYKFVPIIDRKSMELLMELREELKNSKEKK